MAGNAIATAWIQVLPSLDGLQAALVKQSAGAVLTPKVMPAASSGKLFSTAGSMFAGLFNNNFGKVTQTGLAGAFQRGLGRITGQFQSLGKTSASSFATGFSGYIGAGGLGTYLRLGATGAAIGVLSSTVGKLGGQIVGIGNAWGRTNAMIQNAVGDTADWRDMLGQTLDSANEIGVTVQELAESSARLVTLAPATIPDYGTAVKFSSLLSKNMIATGASTQEANAAMRQVTQALGKGVVNGDELTSIMENAPQIAQYLADELNVSVGELKQLGKEGKISGDALKNAVLNNADAINEAFEKMPITADRAFNQITNDIQVSMSEAAIAISENLGNGLRAISSTGIADSIGNGLAVRARHQRSVQLRQCERSPPAVARHVRQAVQDELRGDVERHPAVRSHRHHRVRRFERRRGRPHRTHPAGWPRPVGCEERDERPDGRGRCRVRGNPERDRQGRERSWPFHRKTVVHVRQSRQGEPCDHRIP